MVPPGQTVTVLAPWPGQLAAPEQGGTPVPGSQVESGQTLFRFFPIASPEREQPGPAERAQMASAQASLISSRLAAEGDVARSQAEVELAKIMVEREEQLQRDGAGSQRAVDAAKGTLNIAEATLAAALERKRLLDELTLEMEAGKVQTIDIKAPTAGVLQTLPVVPGQTVSTGETLFQVADLRSVWVRVQVYVGDVRKIDSGAAVRVMGLSGVGHGDALTGQPVAAPLSADPMSATADLYYAVENLAERLRPGERVGVALPLREEAESLVVPDKAILYDIDGGTWVYERTGEQRYRRRRVAVRSLRDGLAVLADGPAEGSPIVTDGAAELFGTEFGAGK
jgi:RND family efflux transporter MFP subunit